MERVGRLRNVIDADDFFVVEASSSSGILAAGTEGGGLVIFDTRQQGAASCFRVSADDAVTSLALSAGQSSCVYVAAGERVSIFDLRQVAAAPPAGGASSSASAAGALAVPLRQLPPREEEVNSLAIDAAEKYLATADDSGCIQVHDLTADKPLKRLPAQHTNMATCVCFRPNRTSEVVSCGQDARLVAWDFAAGRCKRTWELPDVVAAATAAAEGGAGESSLGGMVNPPLAHTVVVGPSDAAGAARIAAVAAGAPPLSPSCALNRPTQGDGNVLLVELDSSTAGRGASAAKGGGGGAGRAWALGRDLGGHTSGAVLRRRPRLAPGRLAGVSHARFPSFSQGRPLLVSGGNDGRVLLWDWAGVSDALAGRTEARKPKGVADGGEPAAPVARVVAEAGHGRKVNWIATLPGAAGGHACFGGGDGDDAAGGAAAQQHQAAASIFVADTSRVLSHYVVRDG